MTVVRAGFGALLIVGAALATFLSPACATTLHVGTVFSSAQTSSQSFLRFYNTGPSAGAVTLTLKDGTTGATLGQWVSPSIPVGAEQQYLIGDIETGTGKQFAKPTYYAVDIDTPIRGYFQHVLWRPADGTLTNLSTCAGSVAPDPTKVSGVHTGLVGPAYASSIVVNNTGTAAAAAVLGIYDARTGARRGSHTTAAIPANGQLVVPVAAMEATVGAPQADMYHYVVTVENVFTGFLQHLVNNAQVGVTTDMTTACAMGVTAAEATAPVRIGAVFSSAQKTAQSFLRLYNTGTTPGRATITLRNGLTGQMLTQWLSPDIAANAEQQFAVASVEAGIPGNLARPDHYAMTVDGDFSGYAQHVLWRAADGTLTNLSTCANGVTADPSRLSAVHSGLLSSGYLSSVVVNNTGTVAAAATLGVYDARDGSQRGTYTTPAIAPGGFAVVTSTTLESAAGAPGAGMYHYVVRVEGTFTGYLQHLLNNTQASVVTDMTTACALGPRSLPAALSAVMAPPESGLYINMVIPLRLDGSSYPYLLVIWTKGLGEKPLALTMLGYDGAGTYRDVSASVFSGNVPTITNAGGWCVADFNGDGRQDVVVANQGYDGQPFAGDYNLLLLSAGDGKMSDASDFLPRVKAFTHQVGCGPTTPGGPANIYFARTYSVPQKPPALLVNDGSGHFTDASSRLSPSILETYPDGMNLRRIYGSGLLADVSGDGLSDLIVGTSEGVLADGSGFPSLVFVNPGNGDFSAVTPKSLPSSPVAGGQGLFDPKIYGPSVLDIRPIHISSPDYADLVVLTTNSRYTGYALQLLINDGKGNFTDQTATRITGQTQGVSPIGKANYWYRQASILDVDGDGTEDIVATPYNTDSDGLAAMVFLNNGAGRLVLAQTLAAEHSPINVGVIGNHVHYIERPTLQSLALVRSLLPNRYMSFEDTGMTGTAGNDHLFLQPLVNDTTITFKVHGPIIGGQSPTVHFFVNGKDYGTRTLPTAGGFTYEGKQYTSDEILTITVPGIAAITELKVVAESTLDQAYFSEVKVNGVALSSSTYYPRSGGNYVQAIPISQYDRGYSLFDGAPWNAALAARRAGTAANPIQVTGGGGTDAVHVTGLPSAYTITGAGTATVRLTENSGLNQNAVLTGISKVIFQDGSVRNVGP